MVGLPLLRPCGSRAPAAWTDRSSSSNPGRRRAHSCGSNYQVPARQHPSAAPRRAPCRGAVTADPSSRPGLRHGPGAVAQTVRDGLTARHRGVVTGHRCTCNPSALSQHRHAQSAQTIRDGLAAAPETHSHSLARHYEKGTAPPATTRRTRCLASHRRAATGLHLQSVGHSGSRQTKRERERILRCPRSASGKASIDRPQQIAADAAKAQAHPPQVHLGNGLNRLDPVVRMRPRERTSASAASAATPPLAGPSFPRRAAGRE